MERLSVQPVFAIDLHRYDGAGNDFLLADSPVEPGPEWAELTREVCARSHPGGGADGVLVVSPATSSAADATLRIFNADGSQAEMCGNGVRCAALYWLLGQAGREHRVQVRSGSRVVFETFAGHIQGEVQGDVPTAIAAAAGREYSVRVRMGTPRLTWADLGFHAEEGDARSAADLSLEPLELRVNGVPHVYYGASMGNPHIATFVPDVDDFDVAGVGSALEHDVRFLRGTNVHFIQVHNRHSLKIRHWERGSGETQACGTGAVACAVIAISRGLCESPVRVHVPGGNLIVEWAGNEAWLEGPVVRHGPAVAGPQ